MPVSFSPHEPVWCVRVSAACVSGLLCLWRQRAHTTRHCYFRREEEALTVRRDKYTLTQPGLSHSQHGEEQEGLRLQDREHPGQGVPGRVLRWVHGHAQIIARWTGQQHDIDNVKSKAVNWSEQISISYISMHLQFSSFIYSMYILLKMGLNVQLPIIGFQQGWAFGVCGYAV